MRPIHSLIFLLFLIPIPLWAQQDYEAQRQAIQQEQAQTQDRIESLEEQIELVESRLRQTRTRYEEVFQQYEEQARLVALQGEQIREMEQEQRQIEQEIGLIRDNLEVLETELNRLIQEYQQTLQYLYKHGRVTELALILTSSSFNQLLIRSAYLARFNTYRASQEEAIRTQQDAYEQTLVELRNTERENDEQLARIREQRARQQESERALEQQATNLRENREALSTQLSRVQQEQQELNQTLNELIDREEAIRLEEEERRRQLAAAETIEDPDEREAIVARLERPRRTVSNAELAQFEETFRSDRNQLPWPVRGGTITESFGERIHPVFGTRTNNPGIDISVPPASPVDVVNNGYVFAVQPLPGFGDVVMVHHGRYKTVYGNLSDIYVTRGQVLQRGDTVGRSGDENSIRGPVLFFMIRDGNQNVNPERWLQ
ncbi:MAG: peptidoglycan DD-metalloendopeptidase family protein [Balneolaceae bacterium]